MPLVQVVSEILEIVAQKSSVSEGYKSADFSNLSACIKAMNIA